MKNEIENKDEIVEDENSKFEKEHKFFEFIIEKIGDEYYECFSVIGDEKKFYQENEYIQPKWTAQATFNSQKHRNIYESGERGQKFYIKTRDDFHIYDCIEIKDFNRIITYEFLIKKLDNEYHKCVSVK